MSDNNIPNVTGGAIEKVPTFDQYKKSPKMAVQYTFLILFVILFTYFLWSKDSDCAQRVDTLEKTLDRERIISERRDSIYMARISALETALLTKSRALEEIGTKVGVKPEDMNNVISTTGGSK